MHFLKMIFTWWHGQTIGTWLTTWRRGRLVGVDEQGNRYYEDKAGASVNGKTRRWVIYNGDIEATRVAPEWHGWLHHTEESPPPAEGYPKHQWQKQHLPNLTGTKFAYRPAGHLLRGGKRQAATGDYEPWSPS